jgi:chaperonin GroES
MELEALFDAVIVKPLENEETTYGNIIVPDLGKEKNEMGTVIAVGPGKHTITGEMIPTNIQIGDTVVLPTMGFTKLPYKGEEYFVGPENQILARVSKKESFNEALSDTLNNISEEEINQIKDISNEK